MYKLWSVAKSNQNRRKKVGSRISNWVNRLIIIISQEINEKLSIRYCDGVEGGLRPRVAEAEVVGNAES